MGRGLRPTSSLVLGALLNVIGDVQDISFLELFAGTGRVGFEVLKKGASMVVWVERNKIFAMHIREKLKEMNVQNSFVVGMDVFRALRYLYGRGFRFDIVFMDPPYEMGYVEIVANALRKFNVVHGKGCVIAEYRKGEVGSALIEKEYVYGDTALGILRLENMLKKE
ncbi:MAG: RsmD family RNA methyltransferase [Synergistetes bacterium]|nr:RsmD family RNA methyltransferase [Synergistota bacterium]